MAYYHPRQVKMIAAPGATQRYVWGDKSLAFVRCSTCGCVSHWESLDPTRTERLGVNARLFDSINISGIRIRHFDGADTWQFRD
jgi:hypothetical protein